MLLYLEKLVEFLLFFTKIWKFSVVSSPVNFWPFSSLDTVRDSNDMYVIDVDNT